MQRCTNSPTELVDVPPPGDFSVGFFNTTLLDPGETKLTQTICASEPEHATAFKLWPVRHKSGALHIFGGVLISVIVSSSEFSDFTITGPLVVQTLRGFNEDPPPRIIAVT